MTQKLYNKLTSYNMTKKKIEELEIQLEELEIRLLPSGINYDKDNVQVSPSDPMFEIMTKAVDVSNEKDLLEKNLHIVLGNVCNLIDNLNEPTAQLMMKYRYIKDMSWGEISKKMGFSEQWCYKKNRESIIKLEKYI